MVLGKTSSGGLILALAVIASGCAADPQGAGRFGLAGPAGIGRKADAGFPAAASPDYSKSYEQYRAEHAQRPLVAPALGLDAAEEPGPLKKLATSVSATLSSGDKPPASPAPPKVAPDDPVALSGAKAKPSADLHVSLAELRLKANDSEGAKQQYEKALVLDPHHLKCLLGLARLYDRQGDSVQAIRYYQRAVESHPDDATPLNDLGLCHARNGRLNESLDALQRAISLNGEKPLYRNNIATVLVEMGRVDEAIEHLAVVHGPAVAHYNVGYLLHRKGRDAEAASHFSSALVFDSTLAAAQQWLAVLNKSSGSAVATQPAASQPAGPALSNRGGQAGQAAPLESGAETAGRSGGETPPSPDQWKRYAASSDTPRLDLRPLPPVEPAQFPPSRY